jgi:hypothetical protein
VGDDRPILAQGVARRLIPIRWPHSHKLAGYYDPDAHALIYQDAAGRIIDRVDLPLVRIRVGTVLE